MKAFKIIFILLLALLLISPCLASTLSFADQSRAGAQSFLIYEVSGSGSSLVGLYNTTTSNITLDNATSYILILKPDSVDYLSNPALILTDLGSYLGTNMIPIIGLVFVGIMIFNRRK